MQFWQKMTAIVIIIINMIIKVIIIKEKGEGWERGNGWVEVKKIDKQREKYRSNKEKDKKIK